MNNHTYPFIEFQNMNSVLFIHSDKQHWALSFEDVNLTSCNLLTKLLMDIMTNLCIKIVFSFFTLIWRDHNEKHQVAGTALDWVWARALGISHWWWTWSFDDRGMFQDNDTYCRINNYPILFVIFSPCVFIYINVCQCSYLQHTSHLDDIHVHVSILLSHSDFYLNTTSQA